MKIRHPFLIRWIGFLGALVGRLWLGTLCYRYRPLGPNLEPKPTRRCIYAFWHENMLLPAFFYGGTGASVLISQHADGEMITQVCKNLRLATVRGSTTRGGVEALRQLLRRSRRGPLVITPDGPRGPRRRLQKGLIYLAAKTGLPIVPAGLAFDRPWRLNSWDRFAVPRPWSRAVCVTRDVIHVPEHLDPEAFEKMRKRVEMELTALTELAEQIAAGRQLDVKPSADLAA